MEIRGKIRVPTREYAYIELEVNGTMEQIIDAYFEANQYYFRKQNRTLEEEVPFETSRVEAPHVGLGPTAEQILEGIRNKKLNK